MADNEITVTTRPRDLFRRMDRYPNELSREVKRTLGQALFHVQDSIPGYPPPPAGSTYRRTGTLGRTLGSSPGGGRLGQADIHSVKQLGAGNFEARLGTRLHYAPYVIGEGTQNRRAHAGRWWTLQGDVKEKAKPGVIKLFEAMAQRMVDFLAGKGL